MGGGERLTRDDMRARAADKNRRGPARHDRREFHIINNNLTYARAHGKPFLIRRCSLYDEFLIFNSRQKTVAFYRIFIFFFRVYVRPVPSRYAVKRLLSGTGKKN